jgi:hypothetical protein
LKEEKQVSKVFLVFGVFSDFEKKKKKTKRKHGPGMETLNNSLPLEPKHEAK